MYQPEELTTLSFVALALYAFAVIAYFVVLFFFGKYCKGPMLFWRSEPIMLVTEVDATQLTAQAQQQHQQQPPANPPPPSVGGASEVRSILKRSESTQAVEADGPQQQPLPSSSSSASVPPLTAAAAGSSVSPSSMIKVSTLHYPKPIHQRWAEVILHTAAINAIQTIRGTITGTTFYGGAAIQVMFLTIYFEGTTEHNQLFVFLISCVSLAALICFIQMLRMTYHLNYLVMVLPRRDKTKEELDAEAVGLGVGKEDHTVHELRRQQEHKERNQEAIRTATAAAMAAVEASNAAASAQPIASTEPLARSTSFKLPPLAPQPTSAPSAVQGGPAGGGEGRTTSSAVVDMSTEFFKKQVAKEIEAEAKEQLDRTWKRQEGPQPVFASPVVPVTLEQQFPNAIAEVLGSMLHQESQASFDERGAHPNNNNNSNNIASKRQSSVEEVGSPQLRRGSQSTRNLLVPPPAPVQSTAVVEQQQQQGAVELETSMTAVPPSPLRRRGTLKDVFERGQLHQQDVNHDPPPTSTMTSAAAAAATVETTSSASFAFPTMMVPSSIHGTSSVAIPAAAATGSPAAVRGEAMSLQNSFAQAAAPASAKASTPAYSDYSFLAAPVASPAASDSGALLKQMRRSHSSDGLAGRGHHSRSASTGGGQNHHNHSSKKYKTVSSAKFQNVALMHMLTSSTTPTPVPFAGGLTPRHNRAPSNGPFSAAVALSSSHNPTNGAAGGSGTQTPVGSSSSAQVTPNESFVGPQNLSFETRYAAKLIAHLAVEEELSFRQHEARLAEVLKLMSANYAVGMRLMIFLLPLIFGLFHDGALIGTTVLAVILAVYMDFTTC